MVIISDINKLRLGLKIVQDGEPCVIIGTQFVKPGKGQSFNRIKYRKLISGRILEKTFKSGGSIEIADVKEFDLIYLYNDNTCWYFMNPTTYEQVYIYFEVIKKNINWLIEQLYYKVIFWNNNPIFLIPPHFVELKVVDIQAAVKGDTVSSVMKSAILSTGVVVKVPLFIKIGELIKVDTYSSEYVSRIK